ncbi:MAG TPA: DedA family protein [bacterium]|nr:DedA family protein [bacterium]
MLDQVLSFIFLHKYIALFAMTFFASLTNLTPATPSLIASGSLVAKGFLDYKLVFLSAYLGSVFGDIIAYLLAYFFSKDILIKFGFKKMINSRAFIRAEKLFERNSGKTVFISRFFLSSFGPLINLIAGFSKINYKKFILYDLAGEAIYIFLFTGIGYVFYNSWKYVSDLTNYLSLLLVIPVGFFIYFYVKKRKKLL